MPVPKVRKKPTAREIASALIEMNQRIIENREHIEQIGGYTNHIDRVFGLFLDFRGYRKEFEVFVNELVKKENEKNDKKENGDSNTKDLPKDTKNKRRRSKRVRKKSK
jgi:hypothetical protein